MSQPRPHAVYILSLWQAHTESEPAWRAWLERPSTGERCGFATLDELFDYLKARVSLLECAPEADPAQVPAAGEYAGPLLATEPPTDQG